jgi:hypothetical protein
MVVYVLNLALRKLRQEVESFEASLGFTARLCLKKKKKKKKQQQQKRG